MSRKLRKKLKKNKGFFVWMDGLQFYGFFDILNQFEKRVPLKPVLGGLGSVAPLYYCT